MVIDISDYDWEGDRPLNQPMNEMVIYEMHVGGFTRHPSSGVGHPGTFSAIIEKIPYLKELGITAVELLPVMEFDRKEVLRMKPDGSGPLTNYWGYSTVSFFAPESSYCVSPEQGAHVREFRDLVKALHRAGIAVILDTVFNHTSEGNHLGPTINFKGFCNEIAYHLTPSDRQYYMDYSGCGNTVNCNHPIVQKFILECLEFWVKQMHVDGFRFDEGSILSRGEDGVPMVHPPVIWSIELSESLLDAKIIAEAWDAAGLYQIGYFPGYRWAEWNGRFRDDIRRFVRGDPGLVAAVASRIAGSADIYQASGHLPINSINFVTCHDGFTLNDLVSYNAKHNEANGEDNRDGINDNLSWNCGVEGETDDPAVEALRSRQIRNFAAILLLGPRRAHGLRGRRGPPDPERQQQRLLPGQRNQLVRLAIAEEARRSVPLLEADDRLPQTPSGHPSLPLLRRQGERSRPAGRQLARLPALASGLGRPQRPRPGVHLGRFRPGGRHQRPIEHGRPRAGVRDPGRAGTAVAPGCGHGAAVAARHRRAGAGATDRRPTDAR